MSKMIEKLLKTTTFRTIDVEALLNPDYPSWVAFDPELGYVPADNLMRDGMDFSYSIYSHEPSGQRRMVNYADAPCRINTYGDSFTQCQQVSDGETWQEYLAAHLREPIRNFGSGGYSVNAAYRRLMRAEAGDCAAENIIFNIFDDDHIRSLDAARWIRTAWYEQDRPPDRALPLHGLPWAHLRYDLDTGQFVECPGLCRDSDALRALCGPEHFYQTFKDDQIVRLFALTLGSEEDVEEFEALAEAFEVEIDLRNPATRQAEASKLHAVYGFKSTEYLLGKLLPWIEEQGKRIFIVLSYGMTRIPELLEGKPRFDQPFIDFLTRNNIPYVDGLQKHVDDFAVFRESFEDYLARYFVQAAGAAVFGHYNPQGNLFFAFSIKDELVEWLEPKPPAYRIPDRKTDGLIVL